MNRTLPLELRVATALAAGPATTTDLATRLGEPEPAIGRALAPALASGDVERLDLTDPPTYSLSTKGLQSVATLQEVQGAADVHGHVDVSAAARLLMEHAEAARDVATEDAVRQQAGWAADDAARDRVSGALNDAFARGALTKEQLDDRTDRALRATTMGELRTAADGVLDLPPARPSGLTVTGGLHVDSVTVNPALAQVRWRFVAYAVAAVLLGLLAVVVQPVVGLAVVVAGLALGGWALAPLLATGHRRVRLR